MTMLTTTSYNTEVLIMANSKVQYQRNNINIRIRDLLVVPYDEIKQVAKDGWQIVMLRNVADSNHPHLTPRERECLKLYIDGNAPKQIAKIMQIKNAQTINTMLSTIRGKFNVTTSNALIVKVFTIGFDAVLAK